MRSSLPHQVGIALAALTIGFIALESQVPVDSSPISITGTVLLNGQPLSRGTIRFLSEQTEQPACDVSLIQDGEYVIPDSASLIPATYEVRVSGLDEKATFASQEPLPARYNSESVLRVKIKRGGSHRFNFELTL
jgi:hypothetical protein